MADVICHNRPLLEGTSLWTTILLSRYIIRIRFTVYLNSTIWRQNV